MKPFDEDATCPKCGGNNVEVFYINRKVTDLDAFPTSERKIPLGESLLRTCNRCKYQWPEACISPQEEAVPEQVCAICLGKGMVRILGNGGEHLGVKACPGCNGGQG